MWDSPVGLKTVHFWFVPICFQLVYGHVLEQGSDSEAPALEEDTGEMPGVNNMEEKWCSAG